MIGGYELGDALLGHDRGFTDSGIYDRVLKQRVFESLHAMDDDEARLFLSRLIREAFLAEDALAQGYGIEDACSFLKWLHDNHYELI